MRENGRVRETVRGAREREGRESVVCERGVKVWCVSERECARERESAQVRVRERVCARESASEIEGVCERECK